MNNCDNEYKLFEYVENELVAEKRTELEQHVKECEICRGKIKEYASIKSSVIKFYDQLDVNQPEKLIKPPVISGQNRNFMSRYMVLALFFIMSFVYILFNPGDENNRDNIDSIIEEYSRGIDDSRWNLEVAVMQNKIEFIRAEIKNINNNKNVSGL